MRLLREKPPSLIYIYLERTTNEASQKYRS